MCPSTLISLRVTINTKRCYYIILTTPEYDNDIKIIFIVIKIFAKITSKSVLFQFGGLSKQQFVWFVEREAEKTCLI